MDERVASIVKSLELQNESKSRDLSIYRQRIDALESQIAKFDSESSVDGEYTQSETQIEFITKIAASKSKFSKEAQDLIDGIND